MKNILTTLKNFKKAQGLPINMLVMILIGIILFGLSLALFNKFYSAGDDRLNDLEGNIKTDLEGLECDNNEYICAPTITVRNGKDTTTNIVITNLKDEEKQFAMSIKVDDEVTPGDFIYRSNTGIYTLTNDCGTINVLFPKFEENIRSGKSASIPLTVIAKRVARLPCSFTTIAKVTYDAPSKESKTPIIIKVS